MEVRSEPFETPAAMGGGLGVVRAAHLVLIDQRAPLVDSVPSRGPWAIWEARPLYMAPEARDSSIGRARGRCLTPQGD